MKADRFGVLVLWCSLEVLATCHMPKLRVSLYFFIWHSVYFAPLLPFFVLWFFQSVHSCLLFLHSSCFCIQVHDDVHYDIRRINGYSAQGFCLTLPLQFIIPRSVVPLHCRVAFMSTCGIFWNSYLSSNIGKWGIVLTTSNKEIDTEWSSYIERRKKRCCSIKTTKKLYQLIVSVQPPIQYQHSSLWAQQEQTLNPMLGGQDSCILNLESVGLVRSTQELRLCKCRGGWEGWG